MFNEIWWNYSDLTHIAISIVIFLDVAFCDAPDPPQATYVR